MILVLNCGSQSVKWKLFDKKLNLISQGRKEFFNPDQAKQVLIQELRQLKESEIDLVGHRVVHGGKYRSPKLITKPVISEIKKFSKVAPLHNPFELLGISVAKNVLTKVKHFAVFDTEFFKELPKKAYTYPLPEKITRSYPFIKRYGFHGISHKYLTFKASQILNLKNPNLITLHLGGGASITAIKKGKPIDTSMGFTPMEGLIMTTRTGDIDPGIIFYLLNQGYSTKKLYHWLNFESGIKGISGISEFKKLLKSKTQKSKLALNCFVYKIQKYISAYYGVLNGRLDAIVFSGTIGYRSKKLRNMILNRLSFLKNAKVLVIQTDEEYQIAKEILNLI